MRSLPLAGGVGAAILCLALTITAVAQGGPALGPNLIVLEGADTVRVEAPQSSVPLGGLLNSALPRLVTEYADHIRLVVPGAPTATLGNMLNVVSARVAIEYADHNRAMDVEYPQSLFVDLQAPVVSQFSTESARIRWITDEFATSVVQVGLKSGAYTQTFTDSLFRTEHELALPQEVVDAVAAVAAAGVPDAADATWYVRIISTDLSGNQSTSGEFTAKGTQRVYLPAVKR